jgi:EAL domain-containing protein (putative c-di-GMP-specific phosphodiesterase class I)
MHGCHDPTLMSAMRSVTIQPDDLCWDGTPPSAKAVDLGEALRSDAIEFWYQPKINLAQRRLVGVEIFARYRAPDRVVPAAELIEKASSINIVQLTQLALVSALRTSANLAEIGIDIRLAVNVNLAALRMLPIAELVREYRPDGGRCLGLIFDITERQVLLNFEEVVDISSRLRQSGLSIAVDDFGASLLDTESGEDLWASAMTIGKLRSVGFSELKLDRALVRGCGANVKQQEICRHAIALAHGFGAQVVGAGIERLDEMRALQGMKCDIGQGYVFGRPMSEEDFLVLLWNRAIRRELKKERPKRVPFVRAKPVRNRVFAPAY